MIGSVSFNVFLILTGYVLTIYAASTSSNGKISNDTICYENMGCFYLGYPWSPTESEIYHIPQHPDEIDIKFYLTTRENLGKKRRKIRYGDDLKKKDWTYIIIHGFASSSHVDWIYTMERALIRQGDFNIISVDWSKGCSGYNYRQAIANARTAAAVISRFIKEAIWKGVIFLSRLHLIGHSLGAHLASYVGFDVGRIAKITGLDPSLPGFTLNENEIKLDPGDAEFVDVVHTNAGIFGHNEALGHVDFYMNGGDYQPGCSFADIIRLFQTGVITEYLQCSHSRAQIYFIESLQYSCKFWGRPWNFTEPPDESLPCNERFCQIMGLKSDFLPGRGVYYVYTNNYPPYCKDEKPSESIAPSDKSSKYFHRNTRRKYKKFKGKRKTKNK